MSGTDFLATMGERSRERVAQARAQRSESALEASALATAAPPPLRLHASGFDVIAEIKLHSPAAGALGAGGAGEIAARARAYAAAGAAAVSVLTEPSRFGGSLEHLCEAAAALAGSGTGAMRKDFLVDPWQVLEAREAGASGVLLILRMLDDVTLDAMLGAAAHCGLFVLLEAFDEMDLARARALRANGPSPLLVGLNTRDLRTLEVDTGRLERCREHFPEHCPAVAESGLETPQDVAAAASLGYQVALIGSALMRSAEPEGLVREMLSRGREAAVRRRRGAAS